MNRSQAAGPPLTARGDPSKAGNVFPRFLVAVKGTPGEAQLGDCPFSQRTMLALEEKSIPYYKLLINEYNMPDWLGKYHPSGKKIPVALDMEVDKWIGDSENIVTYLEEQFPEPKLGKPSEVTDTGKKFFPAFTSFLSSKGDEEAETKKQFESELRAIDEHLSKAGGPFLAGDHPCNACLMLAPQLYHAKIATKHLKGHDFVADFPQTQKFLDTMMQRDSWKNTAPTEDYVVKGWKKKLGLE